MARYVEPKGYFTPSMKKILNLVFFIAEGKKASAKPAAKKSTKK